MGARWYDPVIGRWISPDTIVPQAGNPQALNRFSYVLGNPLGHTDPTGHRPEASAWGEPAYEPPDQPLPEGYRYFVTKNHGYYDKGHLNAGDPKQVILDVKRITRRGGSNQFLIRGSMPGPGPLDDFKLFYEATYEVSSDATSSQAVGIALGAFMDFNSNFERWQGEWGVEHSSFAIEDLPSDYIGFVSALTGMTNGQIFSLLGGVEGSGEPPRNVKNYEFTPLVRDAAGNYVNVPWPKSLDITPITKDSGLWKCTWEKGYITHKDGWGIPWFNHGPAS